MTSLSGRSLLIIPHEQLRERQVSSKSKGLWICFGLMHYCKTAVFLYFRVIEVDWYTCHGNSTLRWPGIGLHELRFWISDERVQSQDDKYVLGPIIMFGMMMYPPPSFAQHNKNRLPTIMTMSFRGVIEFDMCCATHADMVAFKRFVHLTSCLLMSQIA